MESEYCYDYDYQSDALIAAKVDELALSANDFEVLYEALVTHTCSCIVHCVGGDCERPVCHRDYLAARQSAYHAAKDFLETAIDARRIEDADLFAEVEEALNSDHEDSILDAASGVFSALW